MPGFGNYSLRLGEEDKVLLNETCAPPLGKTKRQQIPFGNDNKKDKATVILGGTTTKQAAQIRFGGDNQKSMDWVVVASGSRWGGSRYIKTEWRWGRWVWEERGRAGGRYGCCR
jgi:hypothetical protein